MNRLSDTANVLLRTLLAGPESGLNLATASDGTVFAAEEAARAGCLTIREGHARLTHAGFVLARAARAREEHDRAAVGLRNAARAFYLADADGKDIDGAIEALNQAAHRLAKADVAERLAREAAADIGSAREQRIERALAHLSDAERASVLAFLYDR